MNKQFLNLFIFLPFICFGQDFEVAPVNLTFNADPGESQTRVVTVKNHSSSRASFILNLGDYRISNKGVKEYMASNTTKNSIAPWITISPSFFDLNPNEEKSVSVTIQAPVDDFSSRWGMIYVRTTKEQTAFTADKVLSAGIGVSPRIAISVEQSPKSNVNFSMKITKMQELPALNDTTRLFTAIIENLGDRITKCRIYLIASNLKTYEEKQFEPIYVDAYPKTTQQVELRLQGKLPSGSYALAAVLDYGSKTNLEGTQIVIDVP